MISNRDLENVVNQVNEQFAQLFKRLEKLEAKAKEEVKDASKKGFKAS
jgi:hypothetical protein